MNVCCSVERRCKIIIIRDERAVLWDDESKKLVALEVSCDVCRIWYKKSSTYKIYYYEPRRREKHSSVAFGGRQPWVAVYLFLTNSRTYPLSPTNLK